MVRKEFDEIKDKICELKKYEITKKKKKRTMK